jgi:hypothetical protein
MKLLQIEQRQVYQMVCAVLLAGGFSPLAGSSESAGDETSFMTGLPPMRCEAEQTGGFHDYPGGEERYEAALFHPQTFTLEENVVFMMNLATGEGNVDLYLTMKRSLPEDADDSAQAFDIAELECRRVRGGGDGHGYSCVNLPPSEMLLINAETLRFTRTAVGGWTFAGASDSRNGDSIFVEYGQCSPETQ